MKRLLLPLLAAIALPTAVNAFPLDKNNGVMRKAIINFLNTYQKLYR